MLRLIYLFKFEIEFRDADSTARAINTFNTFTYGLDVNLTSVWLPFHFILFCLPLLFHFHIFSILIFQFILSVGILCFISLYIKDRWDNSTFLISLFFIAIMTLQLELVSSMMSEVSFLFFLVLGLLLYQKQNHPLVKYWHIVLMFLCAAMTRFEGWFIFILFMGFDFYKKKNIKRTFLALIPFSLFVTVFEYFQITKLGRRIFQGIWGISDQSGNLNINDGYETVLDRFIELIDFFASQTGLLFILAIWMIYSEFKKREISLYSLIIILVFSLLFFGTLVNSVHLSERYWLVPLTLMIPLGVNKLLSLKNSKIKISAIILSLVLINPFYIRSRLYDFTEGTNEVAKFLNKHTDYAVVYMDDKDQRYVFFALELYMRSISKTIEVRSFHRNIYNGGGVKESKEWFEKHFVEGLKFRNVSHIVFIEDSDLYNFIFKEKIIIPQENLKFLKRVNKYLIYEYF